MTGRPLTQFIFFSLYVIAIALAQFGCKPKEPPIGELLKNLNHPSDDARIKAAWMIGKKEPKPFFAVEPLMKLLPDKNWRVRYAALDALIKIDPAGKKVLPSVIDALDDQHWNVRGLAVVTLGTFGQAAQEAVPGLVDIINEAWQLKNQFQWGLENVSPSNKADFEFFTEEVRKKSWEVHKAAVITLGRIGPYAYEAVPVLMRELDDDSPEARVSVIIALGEIGRHAYKAQHRLIALLRDEDENVRRYAAWALGKMEARDAVGALIALLDDPNQSIRENAAAALRGIGTPEAKQELQARTKKWLPQLQSRNWTERRLAADKLRELGTPEAIKALEDHKRFFPDADI